MANPITAVKDRIRPEKAGAPVDATNIRQRWDDSQKAAIKERQAFWINSAFLGDEQWVTWDDHNSTLVEADPPGGDRLRLREDRLLPTSRSIIAKLLKRPLVFEVPPSSADDASTGGSRIGAAVLADVAHRHNWEELRRQSAWKTWKGGLAAVCIEWDPAAGIPLGVSSNGDNFGTGDTVETVLAVTEVGTEPGCKDVEHARWWIKAAALPPKQVQEMFDLEVEPPADANSGLSPLQRRLVNGLSAGGATNAQLTLVLTYYERPGPDNAKGVVAHVVGQKVVKQGDWPFPFKDRLNLVAIRETPHDSDWLGDTILSHAISPQVTLNHAITARAEHMREAGTARLAVPEGAGDEWDDLSDVPEVVRYFGNQVPTWVVPASMPQWWIEAAQESRGAIDDILGRHDVGRGQTPAGVTAASALALLAEQDDTPLGLLAKEMADAWGRVASLVLKVYEKQVTEGRKARVDRPGQAPEVVSWCGKDLAGQTTAVVPLDSVVPRSDAAQQAMAFQLKTAFPELDFKTFARLANLPGGADLDESVDPPVAKARRENGEMFSGNVQYVAAFDDHAKHIHEHNIARMTARYEASPDDVRATFDAHVQGHEVDAASEAGSQLQKAQVSPALAAAAQANEPPMAGDPQSMVDMQNAHAAGFAGSGAPGPSPAPEAGPAPSGALEGADGQAPPMAGGGQ